MPRMRNVVAGVLCGWFMSWIRLLSTIESVEVHLQTRYMGRILPSQINLEEIKSSMQDGQRANKQTWGPRCTKTVFFTHPSHVSPNILIDTKVKAMVEIRDFVTNRSLWNIVHQHWAHVADKYLKDYDYFVKMDDDSYVSPENFRHFVRDFDPDIPGFFGHLCWHRPGAQAVTLEMFNLGGTYIVNRGALRKAYPYLPTTSPKISRKCRWQTSWAEDVLFSDCLREAGIEGNRTADKWGRQRFLGSAPEVPFFMVRRNDSTSWWWQGQPSYIGSGVTCCSSRPISWHTLKEGTLGAMVYLHYFLYDVNVDPVLA